MSNANLGTTAGATLNAVTIGSNGASAYNQRDLYVDYDEIVIRTTGPIGPVGPGETLAPAPPANLTVQ